MDRRRSLAPERLRPLFAVPGIRFVSLQKDATARPGDPLPGDLPAFDAMQLGDDFADTAALIAQLDLVIAVDSAVAHLAGALGQPVWLLDRFDPCWRWLEDRRDSPWYPTLRLFRQPRAGDWDSVLAAVTDALSRLGR
jgi:ADP-heptose:LPS heptosyltransferase